LIKKIILRYMTSWSNRRRLWVFGDFWARERFGEVRTARAARKANNALRLLSVKRSKSKDVSKVGSYIFCVLPKWVSRRIRRPQQLANRLACFVWNSKCMRRYKLPTTSIWLCIRQSRKNCWWKDLQPVLWKPAIKISPQPASPHQ
jgi:hypothetical protein